MRSRLFRELKHEQGLRQARLLLSTGESIGQVWSSIITPENRPDRVSAMFKKFPKSGQVVTASISPFKINKNGMSYTWDGLVKRNSAEKRTGRRP
jgi:hypothetical protein